MRRRRRVFIPLKPQNRRWNPVLAMAAGRGAACLTQHSGMAPFWDSPRTRRRGRPDLQVSLSFLCNPGETNKMWPLLEQKVNAVRCDLLFTEDINRRMRVPNRLTVANSFSPVDEEPMSEGVPPSFPTHIPVRISLAASDADLRPILLDQQRNIPCAEVCMSLDSSAQHSALGELPFMHMAGRSSAQNRRRLGHHSGRSRRQNQHSSGSRRSPSDSTQLALPSPALHHERLDTCPPPAHSAPLPLLARTGRIYSMQNIFQTMYLLGQVLFHRVQNSLQDSVPPSSQEIGAAPEEVIMAEAAAMRKELARISERLCVLEEQHKAWRKEEPLVYSMLLSACLVNTWLWLWR
ncbi:mitochondrial fission factor homolog A-like isoform X1 [Meleagris gallopavo]|uniref:mitochondrial fission factor homolog A-like isoform X1 n=2 Tax=Meleagris gallopavo TaxID=9103 RepID=UPI000549D27B|nr:mitochondrial fission factor homolog A-like isoform X1 [Meleagris gallopavo]